MGNNVCSCANSQNEEDYNLVNIKSKLDQKYKK